MANKDKSNPSSFGGVWVGLQLIAVAQVVLSVVDWMELIHAQKTGDSICQLSETVSCLAVWTTPFAVGVHEKTGMPIAGWGVVWGLGAFLAGLWWAYRKLGDGPTDRAAWTARVFGIAGIASTVVFAAVAFGTGALCLFCLATYVLVIAYAVLVFRLPVSERIDQVGWAPVGLSSGGLVLAGYLALLYPGINTPAKPEVDLGIVKSDEADKPKDTNGHKAPDTANKPPRPMPQDPLGRFMANLPPQGLQAMSTWLSVMKKSKTPDASMHPIRDVHIGGKDAPVKIVDFSDVRCPHCAQLNAIMKAIKKEVPGGSFSVESRFFPLDAECNPKLPPQSTDGTGIRCTGARALICLEGTAGYDAARDKIFEEQASLTVDRVVEIAVNEGKMDKKKLTQCLEAKETQDKLADDIAYAAKYDLEGTPLVLINGRMAVAAGPFLYGMILAGGNPEHPAFSSLPPPKPLHGHEGHGHSHGEHGHDHGEPPRK